MQPPPPPPPSSSELLSLGTLTLIMAITFLMQASAIAFNSVMVKEYRGVRTLFLATLSLALGYTLLLFQPIIPFLVGFAANAAEITGNFWIYLAICRFTENKPRRWLTHALVPAGYLLLVIFGLILPRTFSLIYIVEAVVVPLSLAAASTVLRTDNRRYRLGAFVTGVPLFVYGLFSLARFAIGLISPAEVAPGGTLTSTFYVLAVYVLSFLWTAGFILMISQRLQSDLNDLAMNDLLTRVRNRRAMQGLLDFEMSRLNTDRKFFSVILLDIDHFKRINDTYGHDAGDAALRGMAQTLQASVRVQDVVSRWGGEEFLILLPATLLDEAVSIADRMRGIVEQATLIETPEALRITFSAGVACSSEHPDVDELCKIADQALYIAKQTRNRVISQASVPAAA